MCIYIRPISEEPPSPDLCEAPPHPESDIRDNNGSSSDEEDLSIASASSLSTSEYTDTDIESAASDIEVDSVDRYVFKIIFQPIYAIIKQIQP